MTVGEALLWSLLQLLLEKLGSISSQLRDLAPDWDFENEVENLRIMIPRNQAVLNDAEIKQMKFVAVKTWLDDLQHVAYDLEDLLDEIETEALRKKVEEESPSLNTNQQQVKNNRNPVSRNAFSFGFDISTKIKPIMVRLEKIAKMRDALRLREDEVEGSSGGAIIQRPPTSSFVNKSHVYGRDKDKKKIIDLLLSLSSSSSSSSPSIEVPVVIPIVGMGGLGKTTLAQLVYKDDRLKNLFDLKAWIYVSDKKFDVLKLTKAVLEAVSGTSCGFVQLDLVQVKLEEQLSGKKFLIVLDDVWHENYNDWDLLWTPFTTGAQGSKIIVTTRSERVSSIMGTAIQAPHRLKGLSKDNCWSLFTQRAFADGNPNAHPNLVTIGKKIVNKCKGLPLAVKTLGGLLRFKVDVDEWEDVLNSEMWELSEDIIPSLRLSYHHLPSHLKRCFAYCSIFPKGYQFRREELVHLWVAEGFAHQKGRKLMEDMATEYFGDLCLRSFFEQVNPGHGGPSVPINPNRDNSLFIMHDLIFDLAVSISGNCRLESDKSCISEKARYSSYFCSGDNKHAIKFEAFSGAQGLRTFLPSTYSGASYMCRVVVPYFPMKIQHDLFSTLRCLRVLRLRCYGILDLPDSISNLIHLRYLDLSSTLIKRLPESITTLFNLQTLLLIGCQLLTKLPKDLANLINLRHLEIGHQLRKTPPGIGRLTSLQTLSNFVVGENSTPRSGMAELHSMLHLRGSLRISNLKNVVNVQDAMEANLKDKHLNHLELDWGSFEDSRDEILDEDVLDRLQPNSSDLKVLRVSFYSGSRFPSWIGAPSFKKLSSVRLSNCRKCRSLPSLGQLPILKDLYIDGNDGVKSMGHELYGDGLSVKQFYSLEKLCLYNMSEWEEWSTTLEEGEEEFPKLRELTIYNCPRLKKFSHCFPALVRLEISNCEKLEHLPKGMHNLMSLAYLKIERCSCITSVGFPISLKTIEIVDCRNLESVPHGLLNLTYLEILRIEGCPRLVPFPGGGVPTKLQSLKIIECKNLELLPSWELHSLNSLKRLGFGGYPDLVSFPEWLLLSTLTSLYIGRCQNLKSLPKELDKLTSLRYLKIEDCPGLVSFSEGLLPITLTSLNIKRCENLKFLPMELHRLTSLYNMTIEDCPGLVSFSGGLFPITLTLLDIKRCENLKFLPMELHRLTSLCELKIEDCPGLVSFSGGLLPITLTSLEIKSCENLKSLPMELHRLTSLRNLTIIKCQGLSSLPEEGLPTMLRELCIWDCPFLKQRCQKKNGEDWSKISHIPHIRIR